MPRQRYGTRVGRGAPYRDVARVNARMGRGAPYRDVARVNARVVYRAAPTATSPA